MISRPPLVPIILAVMACPLSAGAQDPSLHDRLSREDPQQLAQDARQLGDPHNGALVFHRPLPGCTRCHQIGTPAALAPDPTRNDPPLSDADLVRSILDPSRRIHPGFETVVATTSDGNILTGLIAQHVDGQLVLRDVSRGGQLVRLADDQIESLDRSPRSMMPDQQAALLANRQEFLDLVAYLMAIRDGGERRARELQPSPAQIALEIPDYELHIDHAGMIRELDERSFRRGERIYRRVCANCHGTHDRPGSLPTSLRFADGQFKNGSDPYSMYRTLTYGYSMMAPQTWMVPQQKYDVIHYIREAYLQPHNPSQYAPVTASYLAGLPKGDSRGPAPANLQPWVAMDYGPSLIHTYEVGTGGNNLAYKGIAVRLDPGPGGISRGSAWMVYEHDTLRLAAAWTGTGFIDWQEIDFDGQHAVHPHLVGKIALANPSRPGWADPDTGSFVDDQRVVGRDGKRYGPLPRDWAHYRGLYHHGSDVILAYTVGSTSVLEQPGLAHTLEDLTSEATGSDTVVFSRRMNLGERPKSLELQVAHEPGAEQLQVHMLRQGPHQGSLAVVRPARESAESPAQVDPDGDGQPAASAAAGLLVVGLTPHPDGALWRLTPQGDVRLEIPAGDEPLRMTLWMARIDPKTETVAWAERLDMKDADEDLSVKLDGGAAHWPERLEMPVESQASDGPFAVDVLRRPDPNPWLARVRLTGFDFFPGGKELAICSWDGDVWRVSGLDKLESAEPHSATLHWQRIASGLFQPLGLKILDGRIYVTCRDQIVILHDRNGDGETDFYENFNSDHQVTEHFHEFAMGLQADAEGNLYYAKSARHALPAIVPHHGTLLRVSRDGSRTDILATGFRAANGVCLNPDGTFFVTDQEGHWTPKNRINWVHIGGFYGNMFGYHDVKDSSDEAMELPMCWITNAMDRSPAEPLWVDSPRWGPLSGALLNLSYGYGRLYVVLHERVGDRMQGGVCPLPLEDFPTGIIRGRFHPVDQQLYLCGMFAWAGQQQQPGGFYRVRYTGRPMHMPIDLRVRADHLELRFTDPLDSQAARESSRYQVRVWGLKRSAEYGSAHYNEHALEVERAEVSEDGRTVRLYLADLKPTWGMAIEMDLLGADGARFQRTIHNSIWQCGYNGQPVESR